ncbi:TldD/PmbA family protein [Emcibacter sp.]|uniref:TldD/PmbA family protein n=1 Tax=Emcibacter sp. TaxID=1979954 RepID=UPI003B641D1C
MSQNEINIAKNNLKRLETLVYLAQKAGADQADAVFFSSESESVSWRLGKMEDVERSESSDLGLRVIIGKKQAIVSSSDLGQANLDTLVERALDMARNAPEDPWCGLADKNLLAGKIPEGLDLYDDTKIAAEKLKEMARETEELALEVDGITNSQGASAGTSATSIALCNSDGFAQTYQSSSFSLSVSVIAGSGTGMERDYSYSSKRHLEDLDTPANIAREATERALRRLNPQKVKTTQVPVIFDPRVSRTLVGHLASAVNGQSIARGTSFLKESLNRRIFPADIRIIDDPHICRGVSSRPFDGEGVANGKMDLIRDGVLQNWILDSSSARQLGLQTNGHASRGTSSPPHPSSSNLYLAAGKPSPAELMADIKSGFYVTELIGMGVNGITGDYSRGASGFWIENGELTYPVNEITIAGNLKDMFLCLSAASDLELKYGTDAPTLRIEKMMLAGS